MPANYQMYLLALDVFVLTALIMVIGPAASIVRGVRRHLLPALFSLVIIRSLFLIAYLSGLGLANRSTGIVEILSLVFIIWALLKPTAVHTKRWRLYSRIGVGLVTAFLMALFIFPNLTWQPIAGLISVAGVPLIFARWDSRRWSHIAAPIILGVAALLNFAGFTTTSQFFALMGYGALMHAVFVETAITAKIREQEVDTLSSEARRIHAEQLKLNHTGNLLNAAPRPNDLLKHAAQVIREKTQADQVTILACSPTPNGTGYVAAQSNGSASSIACADIGKLFTIADHAPLMDALDIQEQIFYNGNAQTPSLQNLYKLWQENKVGPTLIHPLYLQQKSIGMLIIGNPVSNRFIHNNDLRLCTSLGPQLAAMIVRQQEHETHQSSAELISADLQQSYDQLQQLDDVIESINDGIIISNTDGHIQRVNKAIERILGKSRQDLCGQPFGMIYGDIDSRESIEQLAVEFSRSDQPLPTFFEHDGTAVQGRIIPLRNRRQEWIGMAAILRNVTAEVHANREKQEFVGSITRETRTPLTTIHGYVDLMLTGTAGELTPEQNHFLKIVQAATTRITETVNTALQMVEGRANAIQLDVQTINIEEILLTATQTVASLLDTKLLHLSLDIAPNLPHLRADKAKLKQALEQLLANACAFSNPQETISLKAWLQESDEEDSPIDYLFIAITDHGIGIPIEEQQHIFTPYYRPSSELISAAEDSLQLWRVKELVEAHGGRIWLESNPGQGSTFQVALPA